MKKIVLSSLLALFTIVSLTEVKITGSPSEEDMVNLRQTADSVSQFLSENGIPYSDSSIFINVPVGVDGSRLLIDTMISDVHIPSPQIERTFREYITIRFGPPWGEEALAGQVTKGISPYQRSLPLFFIEEEISDKTFFHDVLFSREPSLEKAIISVLKVRNLNVDDFNREMIRWSLEKAIPYLAVTADACSVPLITSTDSTSSNPFLIRIESDIGGDLYSEATIYTPYQKGLFWVVVSMTQGAYLIPFDESIPIHINVTKDLPVWIGLYNSNQAVLPEASLVTYIASKPDLKIFDAKITGIRDKSLQLNIFSEGIRNIRVTSIYDNDEKTVLIDGIPISDGMNDIITPFLEEPSPPSILIEGLSEIGQVLLSKKANLK